MNCDNEETRIPTIAIGLIFIEDYFKLNDLCEEMKLQIKKGSICRLAGAFLENRPIVFILGKIEKIMEFSKRFEKELKQKNLMDLSKNELIRARQEGIEVIWVIENESAWFSNNGINVDLTEESLASTIIDISKIKEILN